VTFSPRVTPSEKAALARLENEFADLYEPTEVRALEIDSGDTDPVLTPESVYILEANYGRGIGSKRNIVTKGMTLNELLSY
jgi:hypothetical protein